MSGPILDRIDMHIEVEAVKHDNLLKSGQAESSDSIRVRVMKARDYQRRRFGRAPKTNASLTNQEIKRYAQLTAAAEALLNKAAQRLDISPRSYMRLIKVARTIADLESSPTKETPHITEALQYRRQPLPF
jgi:magnesium chelatase family protein